jgi:hypothetical protein
MNLPDKRSRSEASSASRLSPHELALPNMEGFIFLRNYFCDTVSWQEGIKGRGDKK